MNCRDVAGLIDDYLDGELDEVTAFRVRGHLQTCSECRERFGALVAVVEDLAEMPELSAPEELVPGSLRSLPDRVPRRAPANRLVWALGLASAGLTALILMLLPGVLWIGWTAFSTVQASLNATLAALPYIGIMLAQTATILADAVDEMLRVALVLDVVLLGAVLISIWAYLNRGRLTAAQAKVLVA